MGPYVTEKVLYNDNLENQRFKTNTSQFLHRIRIQKFNDNTPLGNSYYNTKLKRVKIKVAPKNNFYTIAWEIKFERFFDFPIPYQEPNLIGLNRVIKKTFPWTPDVIEVMTAKTKTSTWSLSAKIPKS